MVEQGRFIGQMPPALRRITGALALTAGFMGAAAPAHAEMDVQAAAPTPVHELTSIDKLPGYDIDVSRDARDQLAASTVKIYKKYNDYSLPSDDFAYEIPAQGWCTGTKVRRQEHTYISTAAHCQEDETGFTVGLLNPRSFPKGLALDFMKRSFNTYSIQDGLVPHTDRQPLAVATGIAVSTRHTDAALLKVVPVTPHDTKAGPVPRTYKQVDYLPYTAHAKLIPGQEVGLNGIPAANDDEPVVTTGRYIGQMTKYVSSNGTTQPQKVDLVVVKSAQPYTDPCNFGASGSSFIATQTGHKKGAEAKSVISGPLSWRLNSKYDPYVINQNSDQSPRERLESNVEFENSERETVEQQTGVKISRAATICGFTVMNRTMQLALTHSFGNYAPPLKSGKGGGDPDVDVGTPPIMK